MQVLPIFCLVISIDLHGTLGAAQTSAATSGLTDSQFFILSEGEVPGDVIDCVTPLLHQGLCGLLTVSPRIPHSPPWEGGKVCAGGLASQANLSLTDQLPRFGRQHGKLRDLYEAVMHDLLAKPGPTPLKSLL